MNLRVKKFVLLALAAALLFSGGRMQNSLNRDRAALGLTRAAVLENAPPMLAFTTVALGGFRGLISNFLWMRADTLQQNDKFFEANQLADWITKLEPTFAQVWLFQGWNMAYNISVKFKENAPGNYSDRWHWVERGIELLRDDGLRYNPNDLLIYRELAWFFQHKMGQNLDDGNVYYKQQWAGEMKRFFGPEGTNLDLLLNPQTPEQTQQRHGFTNQFKMDPAFLKKVNDEWGPFDWRLPEAHAIYWGAKGLEAAKENPEKVKKDDVMTCRRIIYQSLLQAFHHGRILTDVFGRSYLGPNLELVGQVNKSYLTMYDEEESPAQRDGIRKAHRNFLRDAVYFLYEANRLSEAQKWFGYLGEKYPEKPIIDNDPNSLPKNLTLDEYAFAVIQIDANETSQEKVTAAIQGVLVRAYLAIAGGQNDYYLGYRNLAQKIHDRFTAKTAIARGHERMPLMPLNEMARDVVMQLLDPQQGLPYVARATLRTQVGLPPESAPPTATNRVPAAVAPTNAPAAAAR